jgi:hypothetical protein
MAIILCIVTIPTNAQRNKEDGVAVVFRGGIDLTLMSGFKYNDYSTKLHPEVSFMGGVSVNWNLAEKWRMFTGIDYISKAVSLEMPKTEVSRNIPYYKPKYLQLPLHLGYQIKAYEIANVYFHLGPYIAYGVGGEITWEERQGKKRTNFFTENKFDKLDYGLGAGVYIDYKSLAINLGYDHGLKNITASDFKFPDKPDLNADGISIKNRCIYFTIGYKGVF